MSILSNKIDFAVLVSVTMANPNGDPLDGNRPRTSYSGYGEISDVCIKRKLRNRMQDMGQRIFVQSDDRSDDGWGRPRTGTNMPASPARPGWMCAALVRCSLSAPPIKAGFPWGCAARYPSIRR